MTITFPLSARAVERVALLVDGDADTRRMYAEYLRLSSEWSVEEAADGREALAKAISLHPALVVTETRLPGMSGFDLCRLIRLDSLTSGIAIIVVTGDAREGDLTRARLCGADAVLVKPCLPDRLYAEMERIAERIVDARDAARGLVLNGDETVEPHFTPPAALCPACDAPLRYMRSHLGGVGARHREQWDYFECPAGCGTFQYRQRTRKLRKV